MSDEESVESTISRLSREAEKVEADLAPPRRSLRRRHLERKNAARVQAKYELPPPLGASPAVEGGGRLGDGDGDPEVAEPDPAPKITRPDGRGRADGGRAYEPKETCPHCGKELGTSLAVRAFRILKKAGRDYARNSKKDRAYAFQNYSEYISKHSAVLIASRLMSIDSWGKLMLQIATMLGAPKIKEGQTEEPLEAVRKWLNKGEDDPLPVDPLRLTPPTFAPVEVESATDDDGVDDDPDEGDEEDGEEEEV